MTTDLASRRMTLSYFKHLFFRVSKSIILSLPYHLLSQRSHKPNSTYTFSETTRASAANPTAKYTFLSKNQLTHSHALYITMACTAPSVYSPDSSSNNNRRYTHIHLLSLYTSIGSRDRETITTTYARITHATASAAGSEKSRPARTAHQSSSAASYSEFAWSSSLSQQSLRQSR